MLTANPDGQITGSITIPAGVPVGWKEFKVTGSGGSTGRAFFHGDGRRIINHVHLAITQDVFYDPIAQAFALTEDRIASGVRVYFTARGTQVDPVTVQIREMQGGYPSRDVIASGHIPWSAINVRALGLGSLLHTECMFDTPVHLVSGRLYAIVLLTDNPYHAVAIARLGGYVQAGNGTKEGWVVSQPYPEGDMFTSSNATSWLVHPDKDLCFKLLGKRYTSNTRTVDLGTVSAANVTDLLMRSNVYRPSSACNVKFKITCIGTGEIFYLNEEISQPLNRKIEGETYKVEAMLTGTPTLSPIVSPNPLLITGNISPTCEYTGAAFDASLLYNMNVVYTAIKPGASTIVVEVEVHKVIEGVEQNVSGVPVTEWVTVPLDPVNDPVNLGNGKFEYTHKLSAIRGIGVNRYTRFRILATGSATNRVFISDVRAFSKLP